MGIVALAGVTAIEVKVLVTVKLVVPVTVPLTARITAVPAVTPLAKPAELMVAIAGVADDHVTVEVMFAVVPSL